MRSRAARWGGALLLLASTGCASAAPQPSAAPHPSSSTAEFPRWQHVVVVVMSSRSYAEVIGNRAAPVVNLLARSGATFTDAHAVARPAAPNYFALFAGATYGVHAACPHRFRGPNLAEQLIAAHLDFASYAQGLPTAGSRACQRHPYTTAHNAAASFDDVPRSVLRQAKAFPHDFTQLPAVSFLIPDDADSMVDNVSTGDAWLRTEIVGYAAWASSHRSLLVITWDQANPHDAHNHIPMVAVGAGVPVGTISERVDHYALLATIEDSFGLPRAGHAFGIPPIAALG